MVARTEKRKVGNLAGYQIHVDRKTKNHENKDIDNSKTHLNYDLVGHDKSISFKKEFMDYIEQNKTSKRAIRKDAVVLQDWIIGSSQEFFNELSESETRKYFETAVAFFGEKFGRENIRFATVHMDEQTPHMHMGIVPMKDGKLSSKTIFDRNALRMVQDQLPRYFQKAGFDIQRGVPKSEQEHVRPETYKKQMEKAKLKALEIKREAREQAGEIIGRKEAWVLEGLYEEWHDDWLETKKAFPDFEMREYLDDEMNFDEVQDLLREYPDLNLKQDKIQDNDTGVIVVGDWYQEIDENTPKTFKFDLEQMLELFKKKFEEVRAFIALKWQKIAHTEREIKKKTNNLTDKEKRLEAKIGAFNADVEKFQNTVELYNKTPEKFLKIELDKEMLGAVERLEKLSSDRGLKIVKSDLAEKVTTGFKCLQETVEIQRKYIQHLEFENKRLKEPDKYMTFEDRLEKAKTKQKEMSRGINPTRSWDAPDRGRSI